MFDSDLQDALYLKLEMGESCRIRHTQSTNNIICTPPEKQPACVVTRTPEGLQWYCHRCKQSGYVYISTLSPERSLAILKRVKVHKGEEANPNFGLPQDITYNLPERAMDWLSKYNIEDEDLEEVQQEVCWSPSMKRVIFPFYDDNYILTHYVGRSLEPGACKYITQKRDFHRVYGKYVNNSDAVIYVEDILSAIKVRLATGHTTIALLNASIDYDVVKPYKDKKNILWLDGNMHQVMRDKIARLSSLGIDIVGVYTNQDPKEYAYLDISDLILEHFRSDVDE